MQSYVSPMITRMLQLIKMFAARSKLVVQLLWLHMMRCELWRAR